MKPLRVSIVVGVAALVAACSTSDLKTAATHGSDAGDSGAALDPASLADRTLDSLEPEEARAICLEEGRRTDACLGLALTYPDPAACDDALARCAANRQEGGFAWSCEGASFGVEGSCPLRVDDYLACIDAWNALQTCTSAGYRIPTPEACVRVVETCERLRGEFVRDGRPPPCDPPSPPPPPDVDDDVFGADGCRPLPARFVVLGDSIAQCFAISGPECASHVIPEALRAQYALDLAFETHAALGAITTDLPAQARKVAGGPGHVAVFIWAIGNDLLAGNVDFPGWEVAWAEVFAYFTDAARFPDGATFLLNGQYSIFDECGTAQDTAIEGTLRDVNRRLFLDVAVARSDTVAVDHYPDWLGHTFNADKQGCPHCGADNTTWTANGPHPSVLGYSRITDKWLVALEAMYGAGCGRSAQ